MDGCAQQGTMLANGSAGTQDVTRAAALLTRACEGQNASGCAVLGTLAYNGVGIPLDKERAVALFRQALALDANEPLAREVLTKLGLMP
jgi:hypothetical protein